MSDNRYPVPAALHTEELIKKKSRFIAVIGRAASHEEAKAFTDALREEHPNARHHCWAYVAGPPGSTHTNGLSDDGEPHGTAGRPMLQVLQHCGVGEIICVVVRYFGGTKLGTGGLVRAYSGAVKQALETLPTEERVDKETVRIETGFEHEQALRHQLTQLNLPIIDTAYAQAVTLTVEIPRDEIEPATARLQNALPHGAFKIQ